MITNVEHNERMKKIFAIKQISKFTFTKINPKNDKFWKHLNNKVKSIL